MAEWKNNEYGSGQRLRLADRRIILTVSKGLKKGESFTGYLNANVGTMEYENREDAKKQIIAIARFRLKQALSEIEEIEKESEE